MHRYSKYAIAFALCLSALAGYIDVLGFLELGGYFVSFMSGNTTRLTVGMVSGDWSQACMVAAIIASFVGGAAVGTLTGRCAPAHSRPRIVLVLVTGLLASAAFLHAMGASFPAILLMALAMGAENTVFQHEGDIAFGLTYMTGTLAKMGQRIADALTGGDRTAWGAYLLLWLGLVIGGAAGMVMFRMMGLHALWAAVCWAAVLTWAARHVPMDQAERGARSK